MVAVTVVALGVTLFSRKVVDRVERIDSLLVLPLKNLSGDPEQDYFADGMTDALNAGLAGVSALRVISQTSSLIYRGTHKPLSQIARELNVNGIVEAPCFVPAIMSASTCN